MLGVARLRFFIASLLGNLTFEIMSNLPYLALCRRVNRKVHAYRATEVSVVAVVRHFDVPRGPILSLRCPAPFIEVNHQTSLRHSRITPN